MHPLCEDDSQSTSDDGGSHKKINDLLRIAAANAVSCGEYLLYLAKAFGATGNKEVSSQLYGITNSLNRIAETIREANALQADQSFRDAEAGTMNMMRAVLAISSISTRSEDQPVKPE